MDLLRLRMYLIIKTSKEQYSNKKTPQTLEIDLVKKKIKYDLFCELYLRINFFLAIEKNNNCSGQFFFLQQIFNYRIFSISNEKYFHVVPLDHSRNQ